MSIYSGEPPYGLSERENDSYRIWKPARNFSRLLSVNNSAPVTPGTEAGGGFVEKEKLEKGFWEEVYPYDGS